MFGRHNVPKISPQCPYYEVSKMAPPNIKWCEANLCSYVVNPANTVSNIIYFIVAILIFKKVKKLNRPFFKLFPYGMLFLGIASTVYHSTYTFFTQILDFAGIFIFVGMFISLNLIRLKIIGAKSKEKFVLIFSSSLTFITFLFYWWDVPLQILIVISVFLLMSLEARLYIVKRAASYKDFFISIAFLSIAVTMTGLDLSRLWCNPDNHFIQGHALWHIFSALSLFFSFNYYTQFKFED